MHASLRWKTPPENEPVDLDTVKRHCRIDQDYDDALVAGYLTTARTLAEAWLNRALITQTLVFTVTPHYPPSVNPFVPQSLWVFPLNWPPYSRRPLPIPRAPVTTINSVLHGPIDELVVADPSTYVANLDVEPALLTISPHFVPAMPSDALQVEFVAGYGADGTSVPAPIRHGILLLTAALYENRGDTDAGLPDAAWAIMMPYRLWTFAAA